MAAARAGVRPAVLSPELAAALAPFVTFRHVIPQSYGCTFDERELAALELVFPRTREMFSREMVAFCELLGSS